MRFCIKQYRKKNGRRANIYPKNFNLDHKIHIIITKDNFSFVHGHFLEYYFLTTLISDIIDSQRTTQNEEYVF